jgi:ATP-dependent DNA helicase RecG
MELTSPITTLPKVGPATQEKLVRLGITTVADLLLHTPTSYSDYTHVLKVVDLKPGIEATIVGHVLSFHSRRSFRRRLTIQEAVIEDDTGAIRAIWFNQPFIEKTLEKGAEFRFSGKVEYKQNKLQFQNPAFEHANTETTHTGRLVPVYPLTEGLTHKLLRFWIRTALERVREIPDDLPDYIRRNEQLLNKKDALYKIHFPKNTEESEQARRRLGFDELFTLQLHAESVRRKFHQRKAHTIAFEPQVVRAFTESLPFSLTTDQKKASYEILQDLTRSHPANRLLEGDVGSGKTVCALVCVHEVLNAGFQASLLAPTEILAAQHFETACRLLEPFGYRIALLTSKSIRMHTGETPPRSELLAMIRTGNIQFVVGTHARVCS